jgi:hypothetical protein
MSAQDLDLERFEHLLDVHGADLERWPEELRANARELLQSSAPAQLAWSRAEALAAVLDAAPDVLPSAALSARIAALPARHPQGWAAWWPFGNPFAPLLGWGAAAGFGLLVGSGLVPGLDGDFGAGAAGSSIVTDANAVAEVNAAPEAAAGEPAEGAARESASLDARPADPNAGDEVQGDDWSDFELALGLAPGWEDEP